MSKRTIDQRSEESSLGASAAPQRPVGSTPNQQHGLSAPSTSSRPPSQHSHGRPQVGEPVNLPPYSRSTDSNRSDLRPHSSTRLAGVDAILNPLPTDGQVSGQTRKPCVLSSTLSSAQELPPLAMTSQPSPAASRASPSIAHGGSAERSQRRVLTPRSPSLHRAASAGLLQAPVKTLGAQTAPFPGSSIGRAYTVEPGKSGAPLLPTPSATARPVYQYNHSPPSVEAAMRAGMSIGHNNRAPSGSASPTTSYSSYSQADQTSPTAQSAAVSSTGQHFSSHGSSYGNDTPGLAATSDNTANMDRKRPVGIPISSSSGAQNTYQMMTLETTSGTVQLPVDVQAASRVADEKRRRNAGASARFRQRRKEKEKEASVTIGRLEQQVKELGEDADFYRRERDYLSGVLLQAPGGDRHFPRPLSPRRRRSSSSTLPAPSGGASYMSASDLAGRNPDHGRNVRRRTSTLSLPQPAQQVGGSFQSSFVPQATLSSAQLDQPTPQSRRMSGPVPSPLSRNALPPPPVLPPMQTGPPASVMQAPPQTGPWNPYTNDRRVTGPPGSRDAR